MKINKINLIVIIVLLSLFLCSCNNDNTVYNITYDFDGGITEEDYTTSFKNISSVILPNPSKDNYIFLGWSENDLYLEEIEMKNYNLRANWLLREEYQYIQDNQIFEQNESKYYVYFMRTGCSWCNKIKDDVLKYIYKSNLPQYQESEKLYVVNLLLNGNRSNVFKAYKGEGGQGSDKNFFINNATSWEQLCVPSTPNIMEINTVDNKRTATFVTQGASNIVKELSKALKEKYISIENVNKYQINYDLDEGSIDTTYSTFFYDWSNVILPIPVKDGYIFAGWFENETKVSKLEKRDYSLKAIWLKEEEIKTIEDKNIFDQDEDVYYIVFTNQSSKKISEMMEIMNYYQSLNKLYKYGNIYNVYIINENNEQSIIRRGYYGENGQGENGENFVNGVELWSDLMIKNTNIMIKIENKNGKKIAEYICYGQEEITLYFDKIINK